MRGRAGATQPTAGHAVSRRVGARLPGPAAVTAPSMQARGTYTLTTRCTFGGTGTWLHASA